MPATRGPGAQVSALETSCQTGSWGSRAQLHRALNASRDALKDPYCAQLSPHLSELTQGVPPKLVTAQPCLPTLGF